MSRFTLSVTFRTTTPESADHGEYADHGFAYEPAPVSFREALAIIEARAPFDGLEVRPHELGDCIILLGSDPEINYHAGSETLYDVHVAGRARDTARLLLAWRERKDRRETALEVYLKRTRTRERRAR